MASKKGQKDASDAFATFAVDAITLPKFFIPNENLANAPVPSAILVSPAC